MSIRYLLDSNVLSEPVKLRPNERVLAALDAHAGELATCAVVWHELYYGAARLPASKKRRALDAYLENVRGILPILSYDENSASYHARERARLGKKGADPPFADAQIAAIAYANRLTVVTANTRDFRRFRGLALEDWSR